VALSGDGKHMATAWSMWEVSTGKRLQTFEGQDDWVSSVALSGDGK
jgi:hypothetical protein